MFAFIVSYVFNVFFIYIFDIDSLAVLPNGQRQWSAKTNLLPLPVIKYFMDKPS